MSWLDKLERRYGRYYIPNLMAGVVGGQAVVWVLVMLFWGPLYSLLTLNRLGLFHGQLWRLVSFIFVPELYQNPLFLIIALYFYYFIGTSLERQWGGFRFNLYYLVGMVGAWAACLLCGSWNGGGLLLSLFFAYACLYPNMQVLLFFVLPIKVKWLGIAAAVLWGWDFLRCAPLYKVGMVLELAGFLLFFGKDLFHTVRRYFTDRRRRSDWNNNYRR